LPHSVTIAWDTTKAGKHAIDYLTSFDRTESLANPCLAVSGCSLSGPKTTFAIPPDPNVTGAGVTPLAGKFTMFNGTITSVSAYTLYSGTYGSDSSTKVTITFTTTASNPVLAWAGHIATRVDWGANNSAISISGSPYHMRVLDLDTKGGNQDRALTSDAVIFPASITIIKDAVPDDHQQFNYSATGGLTPATFVLDDDATLPSPSATSNTQTYPGLTTFATYSVTEAAVTGWALTGISCQVTSPNGGSTSSNTTTGTVSINLKEGENWTCTYTNTRQGSNLIVIKHVVNDNGGTASASDFTMSVTGSSPSPASFAGAESPGTTVALNAGSYSVGESGPSGYASSFSADCTGTMSAGQTKTCTVTNNDVQPTLIVIKHVVNDNGGTASASDFTMSVTGSSPSPASFAGAESPGTAVALNAGSYSVGESGPSGYASSFSADCTGTISAGQTKTCTVTNDDTKASPTIDTGQVWTLNDTATLSGIRPGAPDAAVSTVLFRLFNDPGCSTEIYRETANVVNGAAATATGYSTKVPGTYYWTAFYSGDSYNDSRPGQCGQEITNISTGSGGIATQGLAGGLGGSALLLLGLSIRKRTRRRAS
jgi:hypothetical protein